MKLQQTVGSYEMAEENCEKEKQNSCEKEDINILILEKNITFD